MSERIDNWTTTAAVESGEPDGEAIRRAARRYCKRLALLTFIGLGAVLAASLFYDASETGPDGNYFTICLFKNITALPCPGCGLTHSFCSLGKGDVGDAFRYNQLGPFLFLFLFLLWVRAIFILTGFERPVLAYDNLASRINLPLIIAIAFLLFGLGRILFLMLTR